MALSKKLEQGRKVFGQRAWAKAYTLLSSLDRETSLIPEDLVRLAKAAYLIGEEADCIDSWTRAHHEYQKQDNIPQAANCAFWLGMTLFNQGEHAQGSGWMARTQRLVKKHQQECVERGFLLVPQALQCLRQNNPEEAHKLFSQAAKIGNRFEDPDLIALARLGRGQALIQQHKIKEGTTLFDEAMVAVISDEISPIVAGIVYCAVIETCQKIYDLGRAQEWTTALSRWCDTQPDLVPYRGQCMVRRAEIMQLHGEWPDALNELKHACKPSKLFSQPVIGEAFYRRGELYRLQGQFTKAEDAYREASKWGRNPQPGLALLRLFQGKIDVAQAAIRQVEKEKQDPVARSKVLPAYIDIMLAADSLQSAQAAADELCEIAEKLDSSFLQAIAALNIGKINLANGEAHNAIEKLRHARLLFKENNAVYESAQARLFLGLACKQLGDKDTAEMELNAAWDVFQELSALPDLRKIDSHIQHTSSSHTHGLTPRELDVLQLLVTGKTNKDIASELFISERTVDRHVSNILAKFDVPSRSAATAYAYEHGLI